MTVKIRTFSIVAGGLACDAFCDYCCAPMTGDSGMAMKAGAVNWRNFRKAALLAERGGCVTAMITGKGEPTLWPDQITSYLMELEKFKFPIIELQTNARRIAEGKIHDDVLNMWYELGLTTVCVSIVSDDPEKNRAIYTKKKPYFDLPALIAKLHDKKRPFSVRLTVTMARGLCDSPEEIDKLVAFARENKVEQVTVKAVAKPERITDSTSAIVREEAQKIYNWTVEHALLPEQMSAIVNHVRVRGTLVQKLDHGAEIYDIDGQNLTVTDCLTIKPEKEELRSIIFFPDGHVRYLWDKPGAIIF